MRPAWRQNMKPHQSRELSVYTPCPSPPRVLDPDAQLTWLELSARVSLPPALQHKKVFIIRSNSLPKLAHVQVGFNCFRSCWVDFSETVTKLFGRDCFKPRVSSLQENSSLIEDVVSKQPMLAGSGSWGSGDRRRPHRKRGMSVLLWRQCFLAGGRGQPLF